MNEKILIIGLIFLSGCTSKTNFGQCIGLNDKENPNLEYKYSAWNIGMGIVFAELVIPPIVVALDKCKCPVGFK